MGNDDNNLIELFPHSVSLKSTSKGHFYWDIKIRARDPSDLMDIPKLTKDVHNLLLVEYPFNVYQEGA